MMGRQNKYAMISTVIMRIWSNWDIRKTRDQITPTAEKDGMNLRTVKDGQDPCRKELLRNMFSV